jgi:nitrilase
MFDLPKFRGACVQSSPVFLDAEATTAKARKLICETAANGASLVAFPEVFIAGYPYWNWIMNPLEGSPWFEKLVCSSILVNGPEVAALRQTARECKINVVIGINERVEHDLGALYNTLLIIGADGELLSRHRKLVPTWAEKLTWTGGDGSALRVHKTSVGPLGALACGENTNPLARFTLLAQGELIHVASYISLPVAPPDYNMVEAIKLRAMAHSFEGKVFTLVSCSTISEEIIEAMSASHPQARSMLSRTSSAYSGVIGPDGREVVAPLIDSDGIVYADIDLTSCIRPKQMHDIIGHYNRFDIFELSVNRKPQQAVNFVDPQTSEAPNSTDLPDENQSKEKFHA